VNRKADFLQNESIRIYSHNESNPIDSNRELECSTVHSGPLWTLPTMPTPLLRHWLRRWLQSIYARSPISVRWSRESSAVHLTSCRGAHGRGTCYVTLRHTWRLTCRRRRSLPARPRLSLSFSPPSGVSCDDWQVTWPARTDPLAGLFNAGPNAHRNTLLAKTKLENSEIRTRFPRCPLLFYVTYFIPIHISRTFSAP